jgi:hydrophobe/amphiphile efflux-1 (HAE1) family protein
MLSKFFINRPIFATVLAIIMIIIGLVAVKTLPVAQFPNITPPTVMVTATYPGADARTVAETVGVPIEEQVNGVEGMMYMSSNSSSDGTYNLTITFETGTDIDIAAVKVQNRVSMAEPTLPTAVKQQGVSVMSRSSDIVLFVALQADNDMYDALYLSNYAQLNLVDELSRVKGVGEVSAFGAGEYSMRIWLDPEKMRVRGVTPDDVVAAIESQNMEVSAGAVGAAPVAESQRFEYTLTASGRLETADEFSNIVIRTESDGSMLRLRDVATVELGSESYGIVSNVSGRQAGLIGVYQLPGANALDVSKRVKSKLEELSAYFPPGIHYNIILDTTSFVDASIEEVLVTFVLTTLIVMLVILIFLQNLRTVIIPMITIPVSLIATFAVMSALGFTINTLTLFALVLAIAIVVDDAIVVVENCARIVDEGKLTPHQAALRAMKELQGPVIGEVLVLMSVFIPTAFISGITGELYKQFALTIAVSTAFSGINALTFTPAMCALFLKPRKETKFFIYRWFNKLFAKTLYGYDNMVGRMLKRPVLSVLVFLAICGAAFYGFTRMPTSYVPEEDMGYFIASVQLPTGASINRTDSIMRKVEADILTMPEVKDVISVAGQSFLAGGAGSNVGSLFVVLKPWSERKQADQHASALIERVEEMTAPIEEAVVFALNPPAISGLGMSSGLQMQILDINNYGPEQMQSVVQEIQKAAAEHPDLKSVTSLYEGAVPQYAVEIDRDKVKLEGLTISTVYDALSAYMGSSFVNDFVRFGRVYEVIVSADEAARSSADDVLILSVANTDGDMVPFSAFATVKPTVGSHTVSRYNLYETASVTASLAPHVSSSAGIAAMEDIMEQTVGENYSYAWTGEAYQETQAGTTVSIVLIFAVIMTLLVLAAQYESWTDPVAVVITAPTAILGTVLGCLLMNQSISIYTQIGIILLIGMASKNAILIVEYATDFRKAKVARLQAAQDAGKIRFRPIMMTALAFVFGVMPMLFATGAGAASRVSLGAAVVFGMAVNAIVGTLFIPSFWALLQKFQERYLSKIFAAQRASGVDTDITSSDQTPQAGKI